MIKSQIYTCSPWQGGGNKPMTNTNEQYKSGGSGYSPTGVGSKHYDLAQKG